MIRRTLPEVGPELPSAPAADREARLNSTAPSANRRFTDSAQAPVTLIGSGTHIRGDLRGSDPVEIRGSLEGDCHILARCVVHEGARVMGNIDAAGLVVAGEVEAGTLTADKVEIRASARVRATIKARVVAIGDGAVYEGQVQMEGPDAADGPVFFKEQRKGVGGDPAQG
jgi:cytoskeletal protein CcmA (bactofilin family)